MILLFIYQSDASKYKFTNKERDNESNYDYFGARYYDSRIGRWGGVEPLLEKFISWSPYNYGADNALKLIDVNGLDLILEGDKNEALKFLKSMFYTVDQDRIQMTDEGKISIDVSGIVLTEDAAFDLVNNMVNSGEKFLFEVTDETYGIRRTNLNEEHPAGEKIGLYPSKSGIENLSITPTNIGSSDPPLGLMPKEGYSGQVSMGYGNWTWPNSDQIQPRSNTIFHELAENYYRTVEKQPYERADKSGAHQSANKYAKKYKRQVGTPGEAGHYVP